MTLTISVVTPEGIVLGADSRMLCYRYVGVKKVRARVFRNNATKIFKIGEQVAVTTTGRYYLKRNGSDDAERRSVSSLLTDFAERNGTHDIWQVKQELREMIKNEMDLDAELDHLRKQMENMIKKEGGKVLDVHVPQHERYDYVDISYRDKRGRKKQWTEYVSSLTLGICGYYTQPNTGLTWTIPGILSEPEDEWQDKSREGIFSTGCDYVVEGLLNLDKSLCRKHVSDIRMSSPAPKYGRMFLSLYDKLKSEVHLLKEKRNCLTLEKAAQLVADVITASTLFEQIPIMKSDTTFVNHVPRVGGPIDIAVIDPKDGFYWHTKKGVKQKEAIPV